MDYIKEKNRLDAIRRHELFPEKLLAQLPELYATEELGSKAKAHIKIFHPLSNWYWYISEFDNCELFYGLVLGHESEYGYISRAELELGCVRGLPCERDLSFEPMTFQDVIKHHRKLEPNRHYPEID